MIHVYSHYTTSNIMGRRSVSSIQTSTLNVDITAFLKKKIIIVASHTVNEVWYSPFSTGFLRFMALEHVGSICQQSCTFGSGIIPFRASELIAVQITSTDVRKLSCIIIIFFYQSRYVIGQCSFKETSPSRCLYNRYTRLVC